MFRITWTRLKNGVWEAHAIVGLSVYPTRQLAELQVQRFVRLFRNNAYSVVPA